MIVTTTGKMDSTVLRLANATADSIGLPHIHECLRHLSLAKQGIRHGPGFGAQLAQEHIAGGNRLCRRLGGARHDEHNDEQLRGRHNSDYWRTDYK